MSAIYGRDEGDLKKYRTEIPNIVFTMGYSPHALALYCYLKRTTGAAEGGLCYKSTRTLANEMSVSAGAISAARKELEAERDELGGKPLIVVNRPESRAKAAEVTCVDVWPENFAAFTKKHGKRSDIEHERSDIEHERSDIERKKEPQRKEPEKNSPEGAETSSATMPETSSPEKHNWFTTYCNRMSEAGLSVGDEDRDRVPGNLMRLIAKDNATATEMYRVISRMVVRRLEGIILSPQEALNDVRGVPKSERKRGRTSGGQPAEPSPPEVIEALKTYTNERTGDDLREYAALAEQWDFTQSKTPPFPIYKQLGGNDREREQIHERLKRVARRAMREAG